MALFSASRRKRWRGRLPDSRHTNGRIHASYAREMSRQSRLISYRARRLPGFSCLFFFITVAWYPTAQWFERGSADADRILLGELWRTVTALTLHANLAHVLSNAIGITLFLGALSTILGPGLGSALVLLAGAGGNLANALVHGSAHVSVGASTSVFGAVGMLGGLGLARRGRKKLPRRRAWLPGRCSSSPSGDARDRRRARGCFGSPLWFPVWRCLRTTLRFRHATSTGVPYPVGLWQRGSCNAHLLLDACASLN